MGDDESTNSSDDSSKVSSPEIKELINSVGSQIKSENIDEGEISKITEELRQQGKLIQNMVKGLKLVIADIMWGLEVFTAEHDTVKSLAGVAKALYDLEIFDEKNFLPYYNSKPEHNNAGHEEVHKALQPFAEWLEDDSDSDDSDSD